MTEGSLVGRKILADLMSTGRVSIPNPSQKSGEEVWALVPFNPDPVMCEAARECADKYNPGRDADHIGSVAWDSLSIFRAMTGKAPANSPIAKALSEFVSGLEEDNASLVDQLAEARNEPWPEWVTEVLKLTREYSGYDGYDDGTEGVDLPEEVREAYEELSGYGSKMKARAEAAEMLVSELKKITAGLLPVSEAPRDGTVVIAIFKDDIFPNFSNDARYEAWNGVEIAIAHSGVTKSDFDLGWTIAAPLGKGGIPDQWIKGWRPSLSVRKYQN